MSTDSKTFELVAGVNGIRRGDVVLKTGQKLTTSDPAAIARLSIHPLVKTTTKAPAKRKPRTKRSRPAAPQLPPPTSPQED